MFIFVKSHETFYETNPKLFCFEREGIVENMAEREYRDELYTKEDGVGMGALTNVSGIFNFIIFSRINGLIFCLSFAFNIFEVYLSSLLRLIFSSHSYLGFNFIPVFHILGTFHGTEQIHDKRTFYLVKFEFQEMANF